MKSSIFLKPSNIYNFILNDITVVDTKLGPSTKMTIPKNVS